MKWVGVIAHCTVPRPGESPGAGPAGCNELHVVVLELHRDPGAFLGSFLALLSCPPPLAWPPLAAAAACRLWAGGTSLCEGVSP